MIAEPREKPVESKAASAVTPSTRARRSATRNAAVERALHTLRHLLELSGLSRREVSRRLLEQGSGTDLARVLSGRLALKLSHILNICGILGLHPLEFFQIVFKQPEERSPLLQRLEHLIAPHRPVAREGAISREEFEALRRRLLGIERELARLMAGAEPHHRQGVNLPQDGRPTRDHPATPHHRSSRRAPATGRSCR